MHRTFLMCELGEQAKGTRRIEQGIRFSVIMPEKAKEEWLCCDYGCTR